MKILGRIKKSKVLTAVMTAVLIFQSACPTGLAYAAEQARSSAVLTVTASVDDLDPLSRASAHLSLFSSHQF